MPPTSNFEKMHLASLGSHGDGENSANFWEASFVAIKQINAMSFTTFKKSTMSSTFIVKKQFNNKPLNTINKTKMDSSFSLHHPLQWVKHSFLVGIAC